MKVAVIGAGCSGLAAVKACLEEGLEPVCFERSAHIGGIWHFTPESAADNARVMRETITNTSKEVFSYSDYPAPRDCPVYLHNTAVDQYLNMYAENFSLAQHVNLKTEVLSVRETSDHATTGRWEVTVRHLATGETQARTFDGVFVCTGPYREPIMPTFEGLEGFQGTVLHANQYVDSSSYKDKRVLVVGFANSAVDIATDLCHTTSQVYISTRNGGWLIKRVDAKGAPVDYTVSRFLSSIMPHARWLFDKLMTMKFNGHLDHFKYGLNPKESPLRSNILVSDYLPMRLVTGAIKMKPAIAKFHQNDVEFEDGSVIKDIDVVILATGYIIAHPFLATSVLGEDKTWLYKATWPPNRAHHTLALMYCFRLRGPVFPLVEMQARVATRVIKGLVKLPPPDVMVASIRHRNAENLATRQPRLSHIIQVEYFEFMDELAGMIGCKPNFWRLLVQDWRLALKVWFGPAVAYQYRLQGPGAWSGARDSIMTVQDRTYYPFTEGRPMSDPSQRSGWVSIKLVLGVCVLAWILFQLFG